MSQAWGEFSTKIKSAVVLFMTTNRVGFKYISAYLDQLSNYLKDNLTPFWEEITVIKLWPPSVDDIRIEKVPTRFNLPALLVSVRVVLRHATRHAQRGGDSETLRKFLKMREINEGNPIPPKFFMAKYPIPPKFVVC